MALATITEEQRKLVEDTLAIDYYTLKIKSDQILQWMKQQPHLPQMSGLRIISFLQKMFMRNYLN